MKLIVPIPEAWKAVVLVTALTAAHPSPRSFLALHGVSAQRLRSSRTETAEGWPVTVVEAEDRDDVLGAYVHILDYGAGIVARRGAAEDAATWRAAVLELVRQARPDFQQHEAVCLADQLDGVRLAPRGAP